MDEEKTLNQLRQDQADVRRYLDQLHMRRENPRDYPTHDQRMDEIDIKIREKEWDRLNDLIKERELLERSKARPPKR